MAATATQPDPRRGREPVAVLLSALVFSHLHLSRIHSHVDTQTHAIYPFIFLCSVDRTRRFPSGHPCYRFMVGISCISSCSFVFSSLPVRSPGTMESKYQPSVPPSAQHVFSCAYASCTPHVLYLDDIPFKIHCSISGSRKTPKRVNTGVDKITDLQ